MKNPVSELTTICIIKTTSVPVRDLLEATQLIKNQFVLKNFGEAYLNCKQREQ